MKDISYFLGRKGRHQQKKLVLGGACFSGAGGGYGFGDCSFEKAKKLLLYSFDHNIRIFDTAPIYGFGTSEEVLGEVFSKKRDEVFFISKSGIDWDQSKRVNMSNDLNTTKKMFEASTRRLQSDYIDLYMVHWPDAKVDIRYTLEYFAKLKNQNKIRYIGLCNTNQHELELASQVCRIDVLQAEFNLFNHIEYQKIITENDQNYFYMAWGMLDKGIISQRVTRKRELAKRYDKSDCRRKAPWWKQSEVLKKIDLIQKFSSNNCQKYSMTEIAFFFTILNNLSPLLGVKSIKDLDQFINLYQKFKTLNELEKNDLKQIYSRWYAEIN